MKKRIVLDTNFLYALFIRKDSCHKEAKEILLSWDSTTEIIIPQIVVCELIISQEKLDFINLSKKFTKRFTPNSEKDLNFILSIPPDVKIQIKAIDCLILSICKRYNARLVTFDKKLQKAYETLIIN